MEWDTEENIKSKQSRVALLLRGCGCKKGCETWQCSCRWLGNECRPGCRCVNCYNRPPEPTSTFSSIYIFMLIYLIFSCLYVHTGVLYYYTSKKNKAKLNTLWKIWMPVTMAATVIHCTNCQYSHNSTESLWNFQLSKPHKNNLVMLQWMNCHDCYCC